MQPQKKTHLWVWDSINSQHTFIVQTSWEHKNQSPKVSCEDFTTYTSQFRIDVLHQYTIRTPDQFIYFQSHKIDESLSFCPNSKLVLFASKSVLHAGKMNPSIQCSPICQAESVLVIRAVAIEVLRRLIYEEAAAELLSAEKFFIQAAALLIPWIVLSLSPAFRQTLFVQCRFTIQHHAGIAFWGAFLVD